MDNAGRQASPSFDRRRRRHLQTREEILDAALEVMSAEGVAALNLTEVARRVGLRQPSLYQYFDSKTAVYDALFSRGMRQHTAALRYVASAAGGGLAALRAAMIATVRFSVDNPVLSQLLFTRAVPGFTPSAEAYRPACDGGPAARHLTTRVAPEPRRWAEWSTSGRSGGTPGVRGQPGAPAAPGPL